MFRRGFLQCVALFAPARRIVTVPAPAPAPPKPAPPPRVVLLEVFVAGFRFHDGQELEASLAPGDVLELVRDSGNAHDASAIRVLWRGRMLGHLPREVNEAPARLLDHGRRLEASIVALELAAKPWRRVRVAVELVS